MDYRPLKFPFISLLIVSSVSSLLGYPSIWLSYQNEKSLLNTIESELQFLKNQTINPIFYLIPSANFVYTNPQKSEFAPDMVSQTLGCFSYDVAQMQWDCSSTF